MRQTKFRIWDKQTQKMIYAEDGNIFWIGLDGGVRAIGDSGDKLNGVSVELLEWTGLMDKNEKEIYFDDIVRFSFHDIHNIDELLINYEGTALITETMSFGVGIMHDKEEGGGDKVIAVKEGGLIEEIWDDKSLWTFEIIGNRYENPELLKTES